MDMYDCEVPIVWECIAENQTITKEQIKTETGIDNIYLLAILQKLRYHNLIVEDSSPEQVNISINKHLSTHDVFKANNMGIDMDLIEQFCFVSLQEDYDVLSTSVEFDNMEEEKQEKIKEDFKKQRRSQKYEVLKDKEKDLVNLLGITEDIIKNDQETKNNSESLSSIKKINEKLNSILDKMID